MYSSHKFARKHFITSKMLPFIIPKQCGEASFLGYTDPRFIRVWAIGEVTLLPSTI